VENVANIIVTH